MSETIQGTKSSRYIKEQVPGIANSSDSMTHQSVQNLWEGRGAADVLIHALYAPSLVPVAIEAGSVRRLIKITGHGAAVGDFIRMDDGLAVSEEVAIVTIVDANFFVIAKEINASVGDKLVFFKTVTPTYNKDGSLNVAVTPTPIQYNLDGSPVTVNRDTTVPANTRALPVEIMGASGMVLNVTTGDIHVKTSHTEDSMALGDGVTTVGVTLSNELKVHDADLLTELQLKADLTETQPVSAASLPLPAGASTEATLALIKAKTDNLDVALSTVATQITSAAILTELQLKADLTETQPVSLASVPLPTGASTETTLAALLTELQLKADLLETQPVSAASLPLPSGAATEVTLAALAAEDFSTETTLAAMSAKLPAALGQAAMAASLSVTMASDQSAISLEKSYITGTLKTAQITVGLTEVRATTDALAPSATRNKLMIKSSKNNTGAIYLIPTGGTVSTGMEIIGPDRLEFLYDPTDYYLISDTAAQVVEIVEVE